MSSGIAATASTSPRGRTPETRRFVFIYPLESNAAAAVQSFDARDPLRAPLSRAKGEGKSLSRTRASGAMGAEVVNAQPAPAPALELAPGPVKPTSPDVSVNRCVSGPSRGETRAPRPREEPASHPSRGIASLQFLYHDGNSRRDDTDGLRPPEASSSERWASRATLSDGYVWWSILGRFRRVSSVPSPRARPALTTPYPPCFSLQRRNDEHVRGCSRGVRAGGRLAGRPSDAGLES